MDINWITMINNAVYAAMDKKLKITGYFNNIFNYYGFVFEGRYSIYVYKNSEDVGHKDCIIVNTPSGTLTTNHVLTDREELHLQDLVITIKEHNEKMALQELNDFINSNFIDNETI